MAISLDLGKAWNDAMALLAANKEVVLVIAGIFVFLPNAIATLMMPDSGELEALLASGNQIAPEEFTAAITGLYADIWWIFLIIAVVQGIGVLSLLYLLTDSARPTVGDALGFGLRAFIPYIIAQILSSIAMVLAVSLPVAIGALVSGAVAALMAVVGIVLAVYVYVKFSLSSPVIAIEKQLNPIKALARSWRLTKGNSLRLFAFYVLLFVVLIVISMIAGIVWAIFGIMGEQVGLFATTIGSAVVNMAMVVVFMAVLAAAHRQLSGGTDKAVAETFD